MQPDDRHLCGQLPGDSVHQHGLADARICDKEDRRPRRTPQGVDGGRHRLAASDELVVPCHHESTVSSV